MEPSKTIQRGTNAKCPHPKKNAKPMQSSMESQQQFTWNLYKLQINFNENSATANSRDLTV